MKRSYEAEIMDDFSIQDERIDAALKELRVINRYLGGNSTTKSALKYFINSRNKKVKIADVGSGASDILIEAKKNFSQIQILSVDKNFRVLNSSVNFIDKINADAFNLPFKDNSFDIIHMALFLHHFTEAQILKLLKEFFRIAEKGIIINDLQRSWLALGGIKILTILFSKSEMVKHDGPLSVRRGFKKWELISLLSDAGIKNFAIRKKWAFRLMIVIWK